MGEKPTHHDSATIAELVRRLAEAEAALLDALDGAVDAVIRPDTAAPILLHEAQAALVQSEARYERLLARIAALVIEMDPDGTIRYLNEAARAVTGYRQEQVLGRRCQDVLCPNELHGQIDELTRLFAAGDVTGYELTLRAKDGQHIILEFNSANEYGADGRLQKIVGLGIDITQRKAAEQELAAHQQLLEELIKERTDQLQTAHRALHESEERYRLAARASQEVIWDWDLRTNEVHWNISIAGHMGYLEALQGTTFDWWLAHVHPDDRDRIAVSLPEVIDGGELYWMAEYRFCKADGTYAHVLDRGYVGYDEEGQPNRMVGAMFDVTDLRRAEAAEREQRLLAETLREIALTMISVLDLPDVLDSILTGVQRVVSYETADVLLIAEDGAIIMAGCRGYEAHGVPSPRRVAEWGSWQYALLHRMMETRQPVTVPDIQRFAEHLVPDEWRRAYVGVPIQLQDRVIGFISLTSTTVGFFTPAMVERLELLAYQAALAVQNAQLYQHAQTLAAAQERERLARDLHDAVSQTLFSVSIIAEGLHRRWESSREVDAARLAQLMDLTRGAQAEMRTLLVELRPNSLLSADLSELLTQLGRAVQSRKQIDIEVQVDKAIVLPPDVKVCLYRIAQEALNNVVKHSYATRALVRLDQRLGQMELYISDDGRGFDPASVGSGSFGLQMMQERAEAVGASVVVSSTHDEGTQVRVLWSPPAER